MTHLPFLYNLIIFYENRKLLFTTLQRVCNIYVMIKDQKLCRFDN